MKRWWRGLDASLFAALALLVVVIIIGWQLVLAGRTADAKDRQIDALISATEAKDRAAAEERATAAEAQQALLDYTRALADRQSAVLTYLRANGVDLPVRLVQEIPAPSIAGQPQTGRPRAGRPSGRVSSSGTADRPGKSEKAPGQNKKRPTPRGRR